MVSFTVVLVLIASFGFAFAAGVDVNGGTKKFKPENDPPGIGPYVLSRSEEVQVVGVFEGAVYTNSSARFNQSSRLKYNWSDKDRGQIEAQ